MKKLLVLLLTIFALSSCEQDPEIINLDNSAAKKPDQITICHYNKGNDTWKTITVAEKQLQKHLDHGDSRAPCGYTYVPDDGFEEILIDRGYDEYPLDNYVLTSNINNVTRLFFDEASFQDPSVFDLTGIEDFTSLIYFEIFNQPILSAVINNPSLETLILYELHAAANLDVSGSPNLKSINLNEIRDVRSLDLSQNTNLESVSIKYMELNQLRLDNGNNTAISYITLSLISVNSALGGIDPICVQVDDADYSTANWTDKDDPIARIDATITFSENCGF